jgi:hypothetical protein
LKWVGEGNVEKLKLESILEVLQENESGVVKKNAPPSSSNFSGKPNKENTQ